MVSKMRANSPKRWLLDNRLRVMLVRLVCASIFVSLIPNLKAEELPPVNVIGAVCPVVIEEYGRDMAFEKTVEKRMKPGVMCLPEFINVDRFRNTFSLSRNLHEKCIKENREDQKQAVKYAITGLAFAASSGGLLAPAVVAFFGGELITDAVKCSTKAFVDTFSTLSDAERAFLKRRIDNIATLKDWAGFVGSTNTMLEGVTGSVATITAAHGSVDAYLATLDRTRDVADLSLFLAEVYDKGKRYVKDQVYGEVANTLEDAEQAITQCRFTRADALLEKARHAAADNCRQAGKWYRHTEANVGLIATDPAFREYWKRLIDYSGASTGTGDQRLRCRYRRLKDVTLKHSKEGLNQSSLDLVDVYSRTEERKEFIGKRLSLLERMKPQVNAPLDGAMQALDGQDYAAACLLMDREPVAKILGAWSEMCHPRFRSDERNPSDMLWDIRNRINERSASLQKQIISNVEAAMKDINSCLLGRLNQARIAMQEADALAGQLLFMDASGCRKLVPEHIAFNLSEGHRMLDDQSDICGSNTEETKPPPASCTPPDIANPVFRRNYYFPAVVPYPHGYRCLTEAEAQKLMSEGAKIKPVDGICPPICPTGYQHQYHNDAEVCLRCPPGMNYKDNCCN